MATKWDENWVEVFFILFLAIGFVLAVFLKSVMFSLITVSLAGFVAGRTFYIKRYNEPILPFILIILGFLLGYILGSVWVNRYIVLVFFIIGFILSYYLHLNKIIGIFKSKNFLK